ALGMEMTTDYHARTRLFSAKSFVGNIFAMSTPWLFKLASMEVFKGPGGNEADGMRYVSLMIAAIIVPLSFWWFFKLREPGFQKAKKQEKTHFWKDMGIVITNRNFVFLTLTIFTLAMGFNFVQLLGSYIPIFYVFGGDKAAGATMLGINGTVWAITGVLAVFPLNWISPKLGKRNTLTVAMVLMILAQLSKIVCYNPHYPYLIIIPTVLLSAGMLFFFTLGSSMVGDICDEDELKTGKRSEGSYYAIFWWFIKMGTALASFVAGALIVLTAFDESQVTKVDAVQGNVKELRSKIQYWQELKSKPAAEWTESAKTEVNDAIKESKDYALYLEKESAKSSENLSAVMQTYQEPKKALMLKGQESLRSNIANLEKISTALGGLNAQSPDSLLDKVYSETVPLVLQAKLEKARINAFILTAHLDDESQSKRVKRSERSTAHYKELLEKLGVISQQLTTLETNKPLATLDKELGTIETEIMSLTKQTPYTLFMMRVVEIGLPILLSLISIFFVFRYSLTEKRSHEIKDLLKQRNADRDNGDSKPEPSTV
ncbi:MAG TPA: MFS transporter, partial [Bacteroidales bacterium]|nr:MFS transporter [Bacteroidales bacterium]